MNADGIQINDADVRRLLSARSPDAALLYLYIHSGNPAEQAAAALGMSQERTGCAAATLRQLGLWPEEKNIHILPGERPQYSETDVLQAMDGDMDFRSLYGEIQRLLGRAMSTEELKILLSFTRYLGMSAELISILVTFCRERARQKGRRAPTLRAIEKEAYAWAEQGIDTVEEAAAFIQYQNVRSSRMHRLMDILQIRGRALTAAEERYAASWLEMGFAEDALSMAYERTCLNTGGLNWAYMNKILARWHSAGLHTAEAVRGADKKAVPMGATGKLGAAELEAIQKALQEG